MAKQHLHLFSTSLRRGYRQKKCAVCSSKAKGVKVTCDALKDLEILSFSCSASTLNLKIIHSAKVHEWQRGGTEFRRNAGYELVKVAGVSD